MADETFNIGIAVGVQSALGTINATVRDLSGSIASSDGVVLGDRESGDAESGITIPDLERVLREVAPIQYTEQFSQFLREAVNGLQIAYAVQGNGATAGNPVGTDEAQPLAGIDALNEGAGLSGASGADPTYVYTPATSPTYLTIKLWIADLSMAFQDCLVGQRNTAYTPGSVALRTDQVRVGSLAVFADGVTFPTFDYTTQASLTPPVVQGVAHAWGATRGFETMEIGINNNVEEVGDGNQNAGIRLIQRRPRVIEANARIYLTTAGSESAFERTQLILTTTPTDALSFQLGTAAIADAVINAELVSLNNPETRRVKHDAVGGSGGATVADVTLRAIDPVAGSEYTETYN